MGGGSNKKTNLRILKFSLAWREKTTLFEEIKIVRRAEKGIKGRKERKMVPVEQKSKGWKHRGVIQSTIICWRKLPVRRLPKRYFHFSVYPPRRSSSLASYYNGSFSLPRSSSPEEFVNSTCQGSSQARALPPPEVLIVHQGSYEHNFLHNNSPTKQLGPRSLA